jgi:hypothetical protein
MKAVTSGAKVVEVVDVGSAVVEVVVEVVAAGLPVLDTSAAGRALTNTYVNPIRPATTSGSIQRPGFGSSRLTGAKIAPMAKNGVSTGFRLRSAGVGVR